MKKRWLGLGTESDAVYRFRIAGLIKTCGAKNFDEFMRYHFNSFEEYVNGELNVFELAKKVFKVRNRKKMKMVFNIDGGCA